MVFMAGLVDKDLQAKTAATNKEKRVAKLKEMPAPVELPKIKVVVSKDGGTVPAPTSEQPLITELLEPFPTIANAPAANPKRKSNTVAAGNTRGKKAKVVDGSSEAPLSVDDVASEDLPPAQPRLVLTLANPSYFHDDFIKSAATTTNPAAWRTKAIADLTNATPLPRFSGELKGVPRSTIGEGLVRRMTPTVVPDTREPLRDLAQRMLSEFGLSCHLMAASRTTLLSSARNCEAQLRADDDEKRKAVEAEWSEINEGLKAAADKAKDLVVKKDEELARLDAQILELKGVMTKLQAELDAAKVKAAKEKQQDADPRKVLEEKLHAAESGKRALEEGLPKKLGDAVEAVVEKYKESAELQTAISDFYEQGMYYMVRCQMLKVGGVLELAELESLSHMLVKPQTSDDLLPFHSAVPYSDDMVLAIHESRDS